MLTSLNTQQCHAVTLDNQHALILAGAGSGKTKVLTTRIAWLVQQGMASPYSILAVTFTNKAAKEMQERLAHTLPFNVRSMFIGTFHGLCHRMLRLHAKDAGLSSDFQIMDMQDQASFIKKMLKEQNIGSDSFDPKLLIQFINQAKERGERSHEVPLSKDRFNGKLIALYKHYEDLCQKQSLLDFAELLLRCDELLTKNIHILEHYQNRFKYILIDEFQDTNNLQYIWLKRFYKAEHSVYFAVGDDDQSIYSFRGARVKNMQDYQQEFNVQQLIRLEQNYRSHGHILKCANTLIDNNERRLGKNLFTSAGDGEKIKLYSAMRDDLEASWVANHIIQAIDKGCKAQNIAILYRNNAQSRTLEHTLFKHHIPYKVYGGLRFFERAEIKNAIAYLQLMDNLAQNVSFLRVVNFPTRGIGNKSLEQLQELASHLDINLCDAYTHLSGRSRANIEQFIHIITDLQQQAQQLSLADSIQYMLNSSGLLAHYTQDKEDEDRLNNLKELVTAAHRFYEEEGLPHDIKAKDIIDAQELELQHLPPNMTPLRLFLSYASLESGDSGEQNGVQLMTIHASKGLEFDYVFITGAEEGLFPNETNASAIEDIEEERRLMYVAITRARKNLHISCAQSRMMYGQTVFNRSSRFLQELPEENIHWLSPKQKSNIPNAYAGVYNDGMNQEEDIFSYAQHAEQGKYNSKRTYKNTNTNDMTSWVQGQKKDIVEANNIAQKLQARSNTSFQGLKIGKRVFSTKFGEGAVQSIEGDDDNAIARIQFKRHGVKMLNIAMANLEVLDD
jgi:DNA helicase II / ATP-dependent DNA helicase PcrA